MEINFCFSTETKRWIKFRSSTCSDRCHFLDSFLWITSEWINLELDPRRYLGYLCPTCTGGALGIWQHQHRASSSSVLLQPDLSHSHPAHVKFWGPSLSCWALVICRAPTSICFSEIAWGSNLTLGGRGKVWTGLVWPQPFNLSVITSRVEVTKNAILNFLTKIGQWSKLSFSYLVDKRKISFCGRIILILFRSLSLWTQAHTFVCVCH